MGRYIPPPKLNNNNNNNNNDTHKNVHINDSNYIPTCKHDKLYCIILATTKIYCYAYVWLHYIRSYTDDEDYT